MAERMKFQITGTRADLESFLRQLEYTPGAQMLDKAEVDVPVGQSGPLGNASLVSYIVEFGMGVGAHASWDFIKLEFERFRRGRPSLQLSPVPDPADPDDPHETPAGGADGLGPAESRAEPSHENLSE